MVAASASSGAAAAAAAAATIAAAISAGAKATSTSTPASTAALLAALEEILSSQGLISRAASTASGPSRHGIAASTSGIAKALIATPRIAPSRLASSSRHTIYSPIFAPHPRPSVARRVGSSRMANAATASVRAAHSVSAAAAAAAVSHSSSSSGSAPPPPPSSTTSRSREDRRGSMGSRTQGLASTSRIPLSPSRASQPSEVQRSAPARMVEPDAKPTPSPSKAKDLTRSPRDAPLQDRSEAELVQRVEELLEDLPTSSRGKFKYLSSVAQAYEILFAAEEREEADDLSERLETKRHIATVLLRLVEGAERCGVASLTRKGSWNATGDRPSPLVELGAYRVMALAHAGSPAEASLALHTLLVQAPEAIDQIRDTELPKIDDDRSPLSTPFRAESLQGVLANAVTSIVDSALLRLERTDKEDTKGRLRELHAGIAWLVQEQALGKLVAPVGLAKRLHSRFQTLAGYFARSEVLSGVVPAASALPSGNRKFRRAVMVDEEKELGHKQWEDLRKSEVAISLLCSSLATQGATQAASTLYFWARKAGTLIGESVGCTLLQQISLDRSWALAEHVIDDLRASAQTTPDGPKLEKHTLRVLAQHRARQGDATKLRETLWALKHFYPGFNSIPRLEARLYAHAAAVKGRPKECLDALRRIYAIDPNDGRSFRIKEKAPPAVWRRVIQAHVNASDVEAAEEVFYDHMALAGVTPDPASCHLLLGAYARSEDVDSALALVDSMIAVSLRPDPSALATLIDMFGRRQDSESAAVLMRTFVDEYGITPDRACYTALMDAHVEAGDWDAAIAVFAFLEGHKQPSMRPTVKECNVLLKAHVLRASPVQTIQAFYRSLQARNVEPDSHTFSLLMASASDAGLMDLAEDLIEEVQRLRLGPNLYHFTILIHGYLRLGMVDEAKRAFDDMKANDVRPSSATWSVLVRMYAQSGRDEDTNLAYELVRRLIDSESDRRAAGRASDGEAMSGELEEAPLLGPGQSVETLFTPLILAASSNGSRSRVEELVRELTATGTKISLRTWTMLLDAYRREGDVEGAKAAWDIVFDMACAEVGYKERLQRVRENEKGDGAARAAPSASTPLSSKLRPRRNALCLPLSIVVDALSTSGDHEGVARVWTQVRDAGFGFDNHNWNHLALALVRAGRISEAMTVLDNVLVEPPPGITMEDAERRMEAGGLDEGRAQEEASTTEAEDATAAPPMSIGDEASGPQQDATASPEQSSISPDPSLKPAPPASDETKDVTPLANPVPVPSRPPNRRHQVRINDDLNTRFDGRLIAQGRDGESEEAKREVESEDDVDVELAAGSVESLEAPPTQLSPSLSDKPDSAMPSTTSAPPPSPAAPDPSDLLGTLKARRRAELRKSHWFPSFAVLQALSGALEELRRGGGGATTSNAPEASQESSPGDPPSSAAGATTSSGMPLYSDLLRRHPHAADLLAMHGRKLEAIEERHRRQAMREAYRGFLVGDSER